MGAVGGIAKQAGVSSNVVNTVGKAINNLP